MLLVNLKTVRTSLNMTKAELAAKAGLTERTIENMEKPRGCTLNNAKRIAKVLHVQLDNLTVYDF